MFFIGYIVQEVKADAQDCIEPSARSSLKTPVGIRLNVVSRMSIKSKCCKWI